MQRPSGEQEILGLRDIAHARSGDKGNHANIGVIAWTSAGYAFLDHFLTADAVADYFRMLAPQRVERFRLPGIRAYNFVLHDVLDGGASGSLHSDSQGKTLAGVLLQMPVRAPEGWEEMLKPDCCPGGES